LFAADAIAEVERVYESVVDDFADNIIEIPRITIQQSDDVLSGFKDFDLDTKNLNYQAVSEEILIKKLREQENSTDIVIGKGRIVPDSLENIIVNELINFPEIDYDNQSDMLFKLAGQAVEKFRTYLVEDDVTNVAQYHKKETGNYIYSQMMDHFYYEMPGFIKTTVRPFTKIEEHNFSKYTEDNIYHYTETITPTNSIPSKVFSGFKKACHNLYKFDSKTEKDFAIILENETSVLKWLRPAEKQFHIYWNHNSQRYHPDFVVETDNTIYLVETKKEGDIDSSDVQEKARAADKYCTHATEYTTRNSGKPWKYVLIPHNAVMGNMSIEYLVKNFEYTDG
jgi:type III restriction enzyme